VSTVYQHQLHAHKTHHRHYKRWLVITLLIVGGLVYGSLQFLQPDTQIKNAGAVKRQITGKSATQDFHKGNFKISLPQGWQFMSVQKDIYTIYHFRSAQAGEDGNRLLDVYEDSKLPNFPVNRMLPVVATDEGGLITDASQVSDNCTAYTTGPTTGRSSAAQLAKWQGIEFLCDMANPLRNVVGIGSRDGLNTVKITSLSTGPHYYFITYTENNDKPDYGVVTAAINSFKVDQ
jgi:hypothetical protein